MRRRDELPIRGTKALRHEGTKGDAHTSTSLRASVPLCLHAFRPAFTLIEMLTTVAVLIIVLGLMVSLARYVRDRSAQQLTRNLLRQLDVVMGEYIEQANARKLPAVRSIIPEDSAIVEEAAIRQAPG